MATTLDGFIRIFNNKIEPPVQHHLKNVYSCLAISTLAAAAGGYVHVFTNILQGNFLTSLLALGLMVALDIIPYDGGKNNSLRLGLLTAFSFATGLGLGPLLDVAIAVNPVIIPTAFLTTCLIFICFTLCALFSDQYKWIGLGGTLMSGLFLTLLLGFVTIFTGSRFVFQIYIYLGLAVMCAFILYDTQVVVEKFRRGEEDFIWHSVLFFVDFIDVFRFLVVILMDKEQSSRRKKE